MSEAKPQEITPERLGSLVAEKVRRKAWREAADHGANLPKQLTPAWVPVADEIAFAAGLAKRPKQAVRIYERAWAVDPDNARRASSLAYIYYSAALERRKKDVLDAGRARDDGEKKRPAKPFEDLGELRDGFRTWIGEALRLHPDSVKDLYRLGMFESQVEARKDKPALRAFSKALEAWDGLPARLKARGDMQKYRHRTLYAGARSALRLGKLGWARRLAFQVVREDTAGDHVERVFQLGMAGKVCLATRELDAAERAFRLALDAPGPKSRDFLFGYLAEARELQGDLEGAIGAIADHVPATRRAAFLWRQLGDLYVRAGRPEEAEPCFEACLLRDRMGRHLTFLRLGRLALAKPDPKAAERFFRKAQDARRRQYQSDHREAIEGLVEALEQRGKTDEAETWRDRLAGLEEARGPRVEVDALDRAEGER
jgi:tetratricopeptide (TPR) repeat protein